MIWSSSPILSHPLMFRPLRLADSDEVYFARFVQLRVPNQPLKYSLVGAKNEFDRLRRPILMFSVLIDFQTDSIEILSDGFCNSVD